MIFGGSTLGQAAYGGIPWRRIVVPPSIPEDELPEGVGGTAGRVPKKAYSRLQSAYIDYLRRQKRFEEEFARLEELEVKARPGGVEIPAPLPPRISKEQFKEVAPVIQREFPGIGFRLPVEVKGEYFLPMVSFPPVILPIPDKVKRLGRELTDDEIWFLLEEDVL